MEGENGRFNVITPKREGADEVDWRAQLTREQRCVGENGPNWRAYGKYCHCLFPNLLFVDHAKCVKCELPHYEVERMRIRATEIPFRFYSACQISWHEQESLAQSIDRIVWSTYNDMRKYTTLNVGQQSMLGYFQESILRQVRELMRVRHDLQLLPQDENIFKTIDPAELIQLKLNK
jgi:hypothetical protein